MSDPYNKEAWETVVSWLEKENLSYSCKEEEEGTLTFMTPCSSVFSSLSTIVRILEDEVSLYCPSPIGIDPEDSAQMLQACELMFHLNDRPGPGNFEMNPQEGEIRYKVLLDIEGQSLDPILAEKLLPLPARQISEIFPAIRDLAYGCYDPRLSLKDVHPVYLSGKPMPQQSTDQIADYLSRNDYSFFQEPGRPAISFFLSMDRQIKTALYHLQPYPHCLLSTADLQLRLDLSNESLRQRILKVICQINCSMRRGYYSVDLQTGAFCFRCPSPWGSQGLSDQAIFNTIAIPRFMLGIHMDVLVQMVFFPQELLPELPDPEENSSELPQFLC